MKNKLEVSAVRDKGSTYVVRVDRFRAGTMTHVGIHRWDVTVSLYSEFDVKINI